MKSALSGMHPFWAICVRSCRYGYRLHLPSLTAIRPSLRATVRVAQLRCHSLKIDEVFADQYGVVLSGAYGRLWRVTSLEKRRRRLCGFYTRQMHAGLAVLPANDKYIAAI
jgi:hypothetical protein